MICQKCGSELNMDGTCSNCDQGNVRVMGKSELNSYDGITIDDNSNDQFYGYNSSEKKQGRERVYSAFGGTGRGPRIIKFSSGTGIMNKIIISIVIALIVAGLVFVALPLMVLAVVVGLAIYMIYSFLT